MSLKPEPILETIDDRDDAQLSSSTSDSALRDTPTPTMCYDVDDPKRGPEWKRARTIDDMDLRQRKRNVGNGSLETKFTFFALLATGLFLFLPHNFFLVDKERKGDDQIRGSNNIVGNMSSGKTLKKAFLRSLIIPNTQAVGADHLAKKHTHPLLESDSVDIACNSFRPPEVHTFVLWNPSLWESQERFLSQSPLIEVLDTFIVTENHKAWCLNIYGSARNARGHGHCKPDGNPKVVVVKDLKPNYGEWKTPGAKQVLSTNIYGIKSELRNLANDGFKSVHSSNNVEETKLVLEPLNRKVSDYTSPEPQLESVKDVFNLLDQHKCLSYVVLRSHEEVHEGSISKDIDILVNDYFMFKAITGAQSNHPKEMREVDNGPNTQNVINGKWKFDVRYVGDGYYDTSWQVDMLRRRVSSASIFIQEPLSEVMSLLYHYNVHKDVNSNPSPTRWNVIHRVLPLLDDIRSWRSRTALQTYMTSKKYVVSKPHKPHDKYVGYHRFEALQTAKLGFQPRNECTNLTSKVQDEALVVKCIQFNVTTPIGKAIAKIEPTYWNWKCGRRNNRRQPFPNFCDRPYGEYIFSEASNFANVSGVPLSIALSTSVSPQGDPKLFSIQQRVENLTPYKEMKTETASDRVARVGAGVLDYLLDNCDRLGQSYFKADLHFVPTKGYNQDNWKVDANGALVWYDNGKSMNCYGTKSLEEARKSVKAFWDGWCQFPSYLHVSGMASFLSEHMGLPNEYIGSDAIRGLHWREQALLEYMDQCSSNYRQRR